MSSVYPNARVNILAGPDLVLETDVKRCSVIWLIGFAWAIPCESLGEWFSDSQPIMGTQIHVELWHEDDNAAREALAAVIAEMHRIDEMMSPYRESSELSAMNRGAGAGPVAVSTELAMLLQRSAEVSRMTNGAFDITYASAGRFYDYRKGIRPDEAQLAAAVQAIDYRYVQIDREAGTVRFAHPEVYVDLGGIAKGHAVDRGIELLLERGIDQAMITAGGDSRIIGDRRGQPWTVGVQDPRKAGAMAVLLPLEDIAVSTSGDYQRFFERDGVRYHHILDPTTGDSAREVRSVTILGPDATLTDALSTSVFVLGVRAGLMLIDSLDGIDAIIIDGQGRLHYSQDLLQVQP
jgi:thiamine biosynthesis lipoprotein